MGDDNVAVCKFFCSNSNCQTAIEHYYTDGKAPRRLVESVPSIGFSNIAVSYADKKLKCSFRRQNSLPNVANYFNSTALQYFLLNADGFTDADGKY
jgi:hypothetical protein